MGQRDTWLAATSLLGARPKRTRSNSATESPLKLVGYLLLLALGGLATMIGGLSLLEVILHSLQT